MEYLQYQNIVVVLKVVGFSFKPYYKWNTFNTQKAVWENIDPSNVLNLIINGIPSILSYSYRNNASNRRGFKPYYKWNTFNTRKSRD